MALRSRSTCGWVVRRSGSNWSGCAACPKRWSGAAVASCRPAPGAHARTRRLPRGAHKHAGLAYVPLSRHGPLAAHASATQPDHFRRATPIAPHWDLVDPFGARPSQPDAERLFDLARELGPADVRGVPTNSVRRTPHRSLPTGLNSMLILSARLARPRAAVVPMCHDNFQSTR